MNGMEFWSLAVTAIFVQNLVLVSMLWDGRFFRALRSFSACLVYGVLVTGATTLGAMLSWLPRRFGMGAPGYPWLSPGVFLLCLVVLELPAQLLLPRLLPESREELRRLLPASFFGCAVPGLVLLSAGGGMRGFWGTAFYGFCAGAGYLAALLFLSRALRRTEFSAPPAAFKGLPIALVTAGLLSLGFMGFSGIVIPY